MGAEQSEAPASIVKIRKNVTEIAKNSMNLGRLSHEFAIIGFFCIDLLNVVQLALF